MTKHEFVTSRETGAVRITSLVVDDREFSAFVDRIGESGLGVDVAALRAARHVPLIARGTKTEYLFREYGVMTDMMSVIVRGTGEALLRKLSGP